MRTQMATHDGVFTWQPQEEATAKICNLFTEFQNHGTNQSQVPGRLMTDCTRNKSALIAARVKQLRAHWVSRTGSRAAGALQSLPRLQQLPCADFGARRQPPAGGGPACRPASPSPQAALAWPVSRFVREAGRPVAPLLQTLCRNLGVAPAAAVCQAGLEHATPCAGLAIMPCALMSQSLFSATRQAACCCCASRRYGRARDCCLRTT